MESTILLNSKAHPAVIAAAELLVEPIRQHIRLFKVISAEHVYTMAVAPRAFDGISETQKPAVLTLAFRAAGLVRTEERMTNYEPSARYRKTYLWAAPASVTL